MLITMQATRLVWLRPGRLLRMQQGCSYQVAAHDAARLVRAKYAIYHGAVPVN